MNGTIRELSKNKYDDIIDILNAVNSEKEHKLNQTVVPAWSYLKVNNFNLEKFTLPKIEAFNKQYLSFEDGTLDNALVLETKEALEVVKDINEFINLKESFGVSDKFVALGEYNFNSGVFLRTCENHVVDSPIRLNFVMDRENPTVIDHNIIIAEKGSKVTIVMDYSINDSDIKVQNDVLVENKPFHNGVTKVFAKENSEVTIVKIQRMNDKSTHFDSNVAFVERDGKVNWVTIEIGSEINVTNYVTNLKGDNSSSELHSAYLIDGTRKQDIYYTVNHSGRRSESNMEIKGVLKDKAKKLFKGNIDFKKGASKAKGSQDEDVLLLDPTVKTDSVPMLLCEEDDVEGAHAASVGQMDEDKLFYLMSRGFSEKEAKKLVVEAKFSPIFDRVPVQELKDFLLEELRKRLV
jgi:FeS assembly protein SufD